MIHAAAPQISRFMSLFRIAFVLSAALVLKIAAPAPKPPPRSAEHTLIVAYGAFWHPPVVKVNLYVVKARLSP